MMTWQWVIKADKPCEVDTCYAADRPHIKSQEVAVNPNQRSLAYGDGFFTTMGVNGGKVLWQNEHADRVKSHVKALKLNLSSQSLQYLWRVVIKMAAQIEEGILKLIVSRQSQSVRGYAFTNSYQSCHASSGAHVWLGIAQTGLYHGLYDRAAQQIIPIQPAITAICLNAQLSVLPSTLVGLKTLNRLDNVMAAGELEQCKQTLERKEDFTEYAIGEGLVSDVSGQWVEGVMSNVFYQLTHAHHCTDTAEGEQWYTPPIDKSGVNGVMRQVIIDRLARVDGMQAVIRVLEDADLSHIKAMFFCNAVRGVIPVAQLLLPKHCVPQSLQMNLPVVIHDTSLVKN